MLSGEDPFDTLTSSPKYLSPSMSLAVIVARISLLFSRARLYWYHPLSAIAFLFCGTLANESFHAIFTNGMMSEGKMPLCELLKTSRCCMIFSFARYKLILKQPFCSVESLTCHSVVPYGTPIDTLHFDVGAFVYSIKGA